MDTTRVTHDDQRSYDHVEDTHPYACTDGIVFIGHLVEDPETGEELEAFEAIPCRRCSESSASETS